MAEDTTQGVAPAVIEGVIEFCCRNKLIVILAFVAVSGGGIWVLERTPVDAIPDLSENQVIVFTDWMGRSPKEVEDQITYPLSVNLQGLAGVKAVRSSSEFNFSMINIIFDDSVEFYFARTRVLERLSLAGKLLPDGVVPYLAPDATALGQIFWYSVEGEQADGARLRSIQDWYVRYQLNAVAGVAQVASVGGFPREYQVDVTPERLRAYNVTLGQIYQAIARSNGAVGGGIVQKGNAEYIIRGVGWIRGMEDIRNTVVTARDGVPVRVADVATVQSGVEFRRSVLEKDGREVTGGVVMMRYGENPLEVTRKIKEKIRELQKGLPEGVRIVPFYDRTRLIESAIETVTRILEHEMLFAALAILLILVHVRSVFVVVVTLPLSVLVAFLLMHVFGIASNIMSLSGIAISIGILVDQSIVMLENASHRLSQHFGERRIAGDTTEIVVAACRQVGRPIFFSVVIMIISFLPVFALTGQEGKLFHPLAFTKTFALVGTAIVSVTLVPALLPILVRGRLSSEGNNWIISSVVAVYRPTLQFLMHRPKTVMWLFAILLALGFHVSRHLGREFMPPLDEGSIMDMPVTTPRASVTQVADDLKARNALIRSVPEIEMVVGKAGRAETPTDPSPLDMIETVVTLRPKECWVKRKIMPDDALEEAGRVLALLEKSGTVEPAVDELTRKAFVKEVSAGAVERFDAMVRPELARKALEQDAVVAEKSVRFVAERVFAQVKAHGGWGTPFAPPEQEAFLADFANEWLGRFWSNPEVYDVEACVNDVLARLEAQGRLGLERGTVLAPVKGRWSAAWDGFKDSVGLEVLDFSAETRIALEEFRAREWAEWTKVTNQAVFDRVMVLFGRALLAEMETAARMKERWNGEARPGEVTPEEIGKAFGRHAFLWAKTKEDLLRELNGVVNQIGWANIWTQPIINRVDMLATGVRTQLAVKVFGRAQEEIQAISEQVSEVLKAIPGAVDVVADQTVGKGYVEVEVDRGRAARYGINVGDIQDTIEVALGGKAITVTVEGRERYPVRLRYARDYRTDEKAVGDILVGQGGMSAAPAGTGGQAMADTPVIYLRDVAAIRVVEGPVMIKSENGLLRSYVQLNVRDRDIVGFLEEAQRAVQAKVKLTEGTFLEWTGQFEHQVRAKKTLRVVFPAVLLLIFVILYITYHDFTHALLMMMAVPGALAGGVLFQALFGYNFSVAVWVGYIACFGMATETGIIMLVYLREAIAERGGLAGIASVEALERAVVDGAVHRLRPKFLTEATAIVGLAPMLWSRGVGAEVIAPMAAPVLGGLLIADEVIDIFLPVLFYHVEARRWGKLHGETPEGGTREEGVSHA